MTQNRPYRENLSSIMSPARSLYSTARRKSRDPYSNYNKDLYNPNYLNQTELNITQNNLRDLNSIHHNTTLGNINSLSKPRLNNTNIYSQPYLTQLSNVYSNLKNEQTLNRLNSQNNLNNTILSSSNPNLSSNHNNLVANVTLNNLKEENERLKTSNSVFSKSNLDLKNQIRLLQIELSASNGNPGSIQYRVDEDPQIANFVQNLKGALATSQSTNQELTSMFDALQKKISDISKENLILKEQNDLANKELESLSKKFSDTRFSIDELTSEQRKLENEKSILLIHKNDFEEKYKISEEKIENLLSINDTHLKCKNDNLEMIENLKATIDALRRSNGENDTSKSMLIEKIEGLEGLIKEKTYNMESVQAKLKNYENDREYFNQELKVMEKELKDKDKLIESIQQKYHEMSTDCERAKSRIEALNMNIDERDQTINNLKTSINFITSTIDEYKQDYDKIKNQTDTDSTEKNKLLKEIEFTQKKFSDISSQYDSLLKDKEILQKRNVEIENELNEKKLALGKLNFEMDVIVQKLENNQIFMEKMQGEMKNSKMSKINEDFQAEISKSNEERNKRMKEFEKTISAKNKQIEELQKQIQDINKVNEGKVAEMQNLLNKKNASEKDLEFKTNDKITELKHEIEVFKQEIVHFKQEKERENSELVQKYNSLKNLYDQLVVLNKSYEKTNNELINNKVINSNNNGYKDSWFIHEPHKNDVKAASKDPEKNNVKPNVVETSNNSVKNLFGDHSFNADSILKKIREATSAAQQNANTGNTNFKNTGEVKKNEKPADNKPANLVSSGANNNQFNLVSSGANNNQFNLVSSGANNYSTGGLVSSGANNYGAYNYGTGANNDNNNNQYSMVSSGVHNYTGGFGNSMSNSGNYIKPNYDIPLVSGGNSNTNKFDTNNYNLLSSGNPISNDYSTKYDGNSNYIYGGVPSNIYYTGSAINNLNTNTSNIYPSANYSSSLYDKK